MTNKAMPKLHKAPQLPLSHPGATPDSDRARKPPLTEPSATDQELIPGDRVEGLGDFGKPTGEFGTVELANEEDAIVKWDDDGRKRLHRRSRKFSLSQPLLRGRNLLAHSVFCNGWTKQCTRKRPKHDPP